jgi:hypothetical protein
MARANILFLANALWCFLLFLGFGVSGFNPIHLGLIECRSRKESDILAQTEIAI